MKPFSKFIILSFIFLSLFNCSKAQYVTLEGKQFKDGTGNDFYPVILNYAVSFAFKTWPITGVNDIEVNPHFNHGLSDLFTNLNGPQALLYEFQEIHDHLGFNTVRINTTMIRHNSAASCHCDIEDQFGGPPIQPPYFIQHWFWPNFTGAPHDNKCFGFNAPYTVPPNATPGNIMMYYFLQKMEEVIDLADQAGLKVLLQTADGFELFNGNIATGGSITNQDAVDDYQAYLVVLADYFKTNTTIMAYDFGNEPNYKDGLNNVWGRHKQEICGFMNQLYTAVKQADHNHLITIGVGDHGSELSWDTDIMKTDFACLHFYPNIDYKFDFNSTLSGNNQATVLEHARNRMFDLIYWASTYVQRPWILEEVGFMSNDDPDYYPCYGGYGNTGTDMNTFVTALLPEIKNCGVSGIGWWYFQDGYPTTVPGCSPPPNVLEESIDAYRQRFWGLLSTGEPVSGDYSALRKQPACSTLAAFDWYATASPCNSGPASASYDINDHYYNPFLHPANPDPAREISATVVDQEGNPVKGAVVFANTYLGPNPVDAMKNDLHYTFTDEDGYFKLIPFDFTGGINSNTPGYITSLTISAPGAERLNWLDQNQVVIPSNITLNKINFEYNGNINNPISSASPNLHGWNTLTTSDITITSSTPVDITARSWVHLLPGFDANNGSEVHIFCENAFSECDKLDNFWMQRQSNLTAAENENPANRNEIEISFKKSFYTNAINISPNPGKDKFNIELYSDDKNSLIKTIEVYDMTNRKIMMLNVNDNSTEINLSSQSKGIYYLRISGNNRMYNKKIILQ